MKIHRFFTIVICLLVISCSRQAVANNQSKPINDRCSSGDCFPDKAIIRHARGFEITYHSGYKIIRVTNPWQNAETAFTFLLLPKGTSAPVSVKADKTIMIPARRIVSLSSTNLPFLDRLGLVDELVGIDNAKLVNNPKVRKRISAQGIKEIGWMGNVNLEELHALSPGLVLTFGVGKSGLGELERFDEFEVPYVVNADYMEPTPLGRAEWIKFIAAFVNREKLAEKLFREIEIQYLQMTELVRTVKTKPTVLVGCAYRGIWRVPGGESYPAKLLKDAGADYLWSANKERGSIPLDLEAVFADARDADYWLNIGVWNNLTDLVGINPLYGRFKAIATKNVYNNNARTNEFGGNDYWESGLANPHLLLKDLIRIFHPDLLPDHRLIWYQKLE